MIDFLKEIHSMNTQFEEYTNTLYESSNAEINLMESCFIESSDDNFIVKVYKAVKEFFKKMIDNIKRLIKSVTTKMHTKIQTLDLKVNLKKAQKLLTKAKNKGLTTYEMYDIEEFVDVYIKFSKFARKAYVSWGNKKDAGATTAKQAEIFIKEYETKRDSFQKKLDQIKDPKNKKQISVDSALKSITKYIEIVDNGLIYSEVSNLSKNIQEIDKLNESIKVDLEKYADETGYRLHASTLKDVGHNSMMYIKRNADWISLYAVSAASALTSLIIKAASVKEGYEHANKWYNADISEEIEKDSELGDRMSTFAQIHADDKLNKSRAYKISKATAATTFGSAVLKRELANKAEKRNSIYKDK